MSSKTPSSFLRRGVGVLATAGVACSLALFAPLSASAADPAAGEPAVEQTPAATAAVDQTPTPTPTPSETAETTAPATEPAPAETTPVEAPAPKDATPEEAPAPAATQSVQVLTINDFHGRIQPSLDSGEAGAAVLAGAVKDLSAKNPNTLFVSAGDNIGASTFPSFIAKDKPTIDALKAAGLRASAVGNHEFDTGFADLTQRVLPAYGGPQFGLGANVLKTDGSPALEPYSIQDINGVKVAFIGTVTQETPALVSPDGIAGLQFESQLTAANKAAEEIHAAGTADAIVLLAHDGNDDANCEALKTADTYYGELVRGASPYISAIASGHTHQKYSCVIPDPAGKPRPVIQTGQYGSNLGKIDLTIDTAAKTVTATGTTVPLVKIENKKGEALYPEDPAVAKIVADAVAYADVEGKKPAGRISADILRGGENGSERGVESSMGNLVADEYLWATTKLPGYSGTKAQIGLVNPGGLRADLLYKVDGKLVLRDVAAVQPFANTLVTMTLTGAQLKAVLEEQWQPDGASRPKLHLGVSEGFSYTYLPDNARGEHITSMTFDGKRIQPTDTFTVVTNSFLAAGGDNFPTFKAGTDKADTGQVDLQSSLKFFAAHDVVDPAPLGRAVVGDGSVEPPVEPWATVDVGSGTVVQGGSLLVKVHALEPGVQIGATLHSDPIVVENIPVADASGSTAFTIDIPADFAVGEHTLVVTAEGQEPIETAVTVTARAPKPTPSPSTTEPGTDGNGNGGKGHLATTGSEAPITIGLLAAMLVAAGALTVAARRRVS